MWCRKAGTSPKPHQKTDFPFSFMALVLCLSVLGAGRADEKFHSIHCVSESLEPGSATFAKLPPPQQSAAWLSSWSIISSHTPSFCPVTIVCRVVPHRLGQGHCEVCGHMEELWFPKWQPTWSGHVLRSALRGHLTKPVASLVCIMAHCSGHLPSWSSGHFQSQ